MKRWLHNVLHSFAFRLLLLHFREHFILVLFWIFIVLILHGAVFSLFGIRLLLLLPEYRGETSPLSYTLLGGTFGGLWMTWNLVTYLLYARRFPFLGTLSWPLRLFSFNNSMLPLAMTVHYLILSGRLQVSEGGFSREEALLNLLAFLGGCVLIMVILSLYLTLTNKDIYHFGHRLSKQMEKREDRDPGKENWGVENYISARGHFRRTRTLTGEETGVIRDIYRQNHLNTLFLQVVGMVILILLGRMAELDWVRIPAGASLLILLSVGLAMIGAISYWFGPWRFMVFLLLLAVLEGASGRWAVRRPTAPMGPVEKGMPLPAYTNEALDSLLDTTAIRKDRQAMESILEAWKARQENPLPPLVIVTASGGGLRAALWTMQVARQLDRAIPGGLVTRTAALTGASGGVLALAFLRELWWREQKGMLPSWTHDRYLDQIGLDLLNSVAFSLVSNDIFHFGTPVPSRDGQIIKDRGFHFERQWMENTGNVFPARLGAYREPEANGEIPLLFITPSILHDGRRLLISPQGVSHLCRPPHGDPPAGHFAVDAVDFGRFFRHLNPMDLPFSTALRMNATFPYILPAVSMPSDPVIDIIDAGIRDNYGASLAVRLIQQHREWIRRNTSGVVLVQIRCWEKDPEPGSDRRQGWIGEWFKPFGLLGQPSRFQDFEQDAGTSLLKETLGDTPLRVVRFIYQPQSGLPPPSLSFHLTRREKHDILTAWENPANQKALKAVESALDIPR